MPKNQRHYIFALLRGNICWPKCIFIDIWPSRNEFCMNIHLHFWALFMYIYINLQKDLYLCLIRGSSCWLITISFFLGQVVLYDYTCTSLGHWSRSHTGIYGERYSFSSIHIKSIIQIYMKYVILLLYMFYLFVMLYFFSI